MTMTSKLASSLLTAQHVSGPVAIMLGLTRAHPARLLLLALLLAGLAGCGRAQVYPAQRTPSPPARLAGGGPAHIAVLVMENEEYGAVLGNPAMPYLNRLARTSAVATRMYAITHPSLPNYLALTGGATFGIDSDCTDCHVHARGLADQLERSGIGWRAYMEGLPHPCFTGAGAGDYAKKHDPFLYYDDVAASPARCGHVVPLDRLATDERAGTLPRFVWVTPNLCHDMHDCGPASGDRFLAGWLPGLIAALGPRGLLVLTWDEGTSDDGCCGRARGGHVLTVLAGGLARPGARLAVPTDHYSVLQTIEDLLGLPRLRGAACPCTPSLAPLLRLSS
jgi:hypothetical protein